MQQKSFTDKVQRLIYTWANPVLSRMYFYYTSRTSHYRYKGIKVKILPGVFHPRFTISTKYLVDFLETFDLENRHVLELGCGSGLISLFSAKKGGLVTASDINEKALEGLRQNALQNDLSVRVVNSDLFENLLGNNFDLIVINPPYYPRKPKNTEEAAWYCGEGFEYYHKLFDQLSAKTSKETQIIMILSEDCDLKTIKKIAGNQGFNFQLKHQKVIKGELNYIFSIERS